MKMLMNPVLPPILFAIYTDGLLKRLEEANVGGQMCSHITVTQ